MNDQHFQMTAFARHSSEFLTRGTLNASIQGDSSIQWIEVVYDWCSASLLRISFLSLGREISPPRSARQRDLSAHAQSWVFNGGEGKNR